MRILRQLTEYRQGQSVPGILIENLAIHVGTELETILGRLVPRCVWKVLR